MILLVINTVLATIWGLTMLQMYIGTITLFDRPPYSLIDWIVVIGGYALSMYVVIMEIKGDKE